jgi:hypothetical protein
MRGLVFALCGVLLGACAQVWGFDETTGCGPDELMCDGACVNMLSSHDHCGSCTNACAASDVCGNGTCGPMCPIDQMECNGACADLQSDAANCGGCGMACTNGDVCVLGGCEPPCDPAQLSSAIVDPWGVAWDSIERTPAAVDVATVTCHSFGGRLPTATELFRVAANQSAAVGTTASTNFLLSQSADDNINQATIRLSDGATGAVAASAATPYRCVCGAPRAKTFTGNHCNGDPGNACFEVNGYNVDTKNRPSLHKSAAVAECISERAHLLDAPLLAEAIRSGLPNGAGFVMTGDQAVYYATTELSWSGTNTSWDPAGNIQMVDNRNPGPFRCAATKLAQTPSATAVTNSFLPAISKYKSETMDSAAVGLAAAVDACFARGGHLPRATELAELIEQSLPNGSGTSLWSADQVGYDGSSNFLMAVQRWVAQDPRHSYLWDGTANSTVTWDWKYSSHPYRCLYYPVDPMYVAPTTCAGGCFALDVPGLAGARMWFDSDDRPASTLGAAFATCAAESGHVATERDYTEAVRKGLPNGSGAMTVPWLWTSDFAQNNVTVVRWTGVDMAFTDQYPTYMTWVGLASSPYRFRCMWTNELR